LARPPKTPSKSPSKPSRSDRRSRKDGDPIDREEELFFQEVDEELKQERFLGLWKRYGTVFVALLLLAVAAIGGYQFWQSDKRASEVAASTQFAEALRLVADGKPKEAAVIFSVLAKDAPAGYAALSRLQAGAIKAKAGDDAGAAEIYRALANDDAAPATLRDAAAILWAVSGLETADPNMLMARLEPLTAEASPWRHSAREMWALYAEKAGRKDAARDMLRKLAADRSAPDAMRARAHEMLAILGQS
jgi:hypothetical protein